MLSVKEANDFFKQSISLFEKDDDEKDKNKEVDTAPVSGDRTDPPPTLKRSVPTKDKKEPEQKGDGQEVGDKKTNSKDKKKSGKKKSQEAVNYVKISPDPDKRCSNCNSFSTPKSCKSVDGDIDADGLCDIWAEKPKEDDQK